MKTSKIQDIYSIPVLTAISPVSAVDSVQRTPELVVISFVTGVVCYSFVSEKQTAAFTSRCLVDTLSFCWGRFEFKDERENNKKN